MNEDEQRILAEIERQFHAQDPESARRISSTTLQRYLARNCRWAALGLLIGLVVLLTAFASSWVIGVFGFLLMVASGVVLIQNLHKMSKLGIEQVARSMGRRNLAQTMEEFGARLRRRFRGDQRD